MKRLLIIALILGTLGIAACGAEPTPVPTKPLPTAVPTEAAPEATPTEGPFESPLPTEGPFESPLPTEGLFESPVGVPNPASQFCEEQGFKLELRTSEAGTTGYCIFPDGTECEEWAFYRGECKPGTPKP
jgi:putative hemolysin